MSTASSTPRLRIVHVVESLDVGGLEHMVVAMAAEQKRVGHDVRILCLWHTGDLAPKAEQAGVPVACCFKGQGLDWRAARRLRAMLREAKPDVLHTHNAMAHYYAVAVSLGLGIPVVVSTRHGGGAKIKDRIEQLYKLSMRATTYAVAVSKAGRAHFVASGLIPEDKARAVPNGIDLSAFEARTDARCDALRQELGLLPGTVTFGTVGRLNEVKRQGDLLRATRARLDAGDPISLVIVGDGPMRAELDTLIDELKLHEHVRMLGVRRDVPRLLAAMDVFVLCSRTEGYSLALVEASAAALPIIATDVGGNKEIVADNVSGLIVPPANHDALTQAMARLCASADMRRQYGAAARKWALSEGTLAVMCAAYDKLYRAGKGA
jgi:glycosyltransferase involved in cell wall biosynthesis